MVRRLLSQIPIAAYWSLKKPNITLGTKSFLTNYVVPVGPGTVFEGNEGMKIKDIKDGTPNTFMIVEADDEHAVIWTKPDDLPYDPQEPKKGLGGHFKDVFLALACDGDVHAFALATSLENLRAWFTAAAGDRAEKP
jgi:hypothetical protein